jgi:hypothetical protein
MTLSAQSVDRTGGMIRGCTVAQAGVNATGKILMLDASGRPTHDEKLSVRELPVWTDAKTLETLMTAAAKRPRFKVREDHDDSVGARAGYAAGFRVVDDRVVADVKLYDAYRNRDLLLETIAENPDQIGLSIDFTPVFELTKDRALMRIESLDAVDVVDEGAITHRGLFLSAGVDSPGKGTPKPADNPEPPPTMPTSNEDVMSAIGALSKTVSDCMTAMSAALQAKTAAAPVAPSEELKALRTSLDTLAASSKANEDKLALIATENAKMKRERQLLGYRGSPEEKAKLGSATDDVIREALSKQKTFHQMCREKRETLKLSAQIAAMEVLRTPEGKAAYHESLVRKGIVKIDDAAVASN